MSRAGWGCGVAMFGLAACAASPAQRPLPARYAPVPDVLVPPLIVGQRPSTTAPAVLATTTAPTPAAQNLSEGACPIGACSYPSEACCTASWKNSSRWTCAKAVAFDHPIGSDDLELAYGHCGGAPQPGQDTFPSRVVVRYCDRSADCPDGGICCEEDTDYNEVVAQCRPPSPDGRSPCEGNERCGTKGEACRVAQSVCTGTSCARRGARPTRLPGFDCRSPRDCPPGTHCCAQSKGSRCGSHCFYSEGESFGCRIAAECPRDIEVFKRAKWTCSRKVGPIMGCEPE